MSKNLTLIYGDELKNIKTSLDDIKNQAKFLSKHNENMLIEQTINEIADNVNKIAKILGI